MSFIPIRFCQKQIKPMICLLKRRGKFEARTAKSMRADRDQERSDRDLATREILDPFLDQVFAREGQPRMHDLILCEGDGGDQLWVPLKRGD